MHCRMWCFTFLEKKYCAGNVGDEPLSTNHYGTEGDCMYQTNFYTEISNVQELVISHGVHIQRIPLGSTTT